MAHPLMLKVTCHKSNLAVIRDYVHRQLSDLGIGGKTASQVVLAVDEACANCIIHQHQCDGSSVIEVNMDLAGDTLNISIRDSGQAFPIDQYQSAPLEDIVRQRKKGGLGLSIIHKIMDQVEVEQHPGFHLYKFAKRLI